MCDSHKHHEAIKTYAASVGINPSQIIAQAAPGVNPALQPVLLNFNNVYVNEKGHASRVYSTEKSGYTVPAHGVYEIETSLNLFCLSVGNEPIQLTNLARYSVVVWKKSCGSEEPVQLASQNGLLVRSQSLAEEVNPAGLYGINDSSSTQLSFFVGTNPTQKHYVLPGDLIYVTVRLLLVPNGNISYYSFRVQSAGQADNQETSASFFNVKRISA